VIVSPACARRFESRRAAWRRTKEKLNGELTREQLSDRGRSSTVTRLPHLLSAVGRCLSVLASSSCRLVESTVAVVFLEVSAAFACQTDQVRRQFAFSQRTV
jgi:hypothetical protein